MERAKPAGAHGTPLVAEFAAMELGALQDMHHISASNLMRDAVNCRHRHPQLWAALADGRARVWQARRIVQLCAAAGLELDQARWVDEVTTGYLDSLAWGRFEALVEARVIEADPEAAEARRLAAALARFVRTGQSTEHGIKTMVVRATAGDVIFFVAMVDRIAQILALDGDTDPVDVRRSKAIGILATPERALAMLLAAESRVVDLPDGEADDADDSVDENGGVDEKGGAGGSAARGTESTCGSHRKDAGDPADQDPAVPDDPQGPLAPTGGSRPGHGTVLNPNTTYPDAVSEPEVQPAVNAADDPPSPRTCAACAGTGMTRAPATDPEGTAMVATDHGAAPGAGAADGAATGAAHRAAARAFARAGRFIRPGPVDPAKLLPTATLYIHITDAALRDQNCCGSCGCPANTDTVARSVHRARGAVGRVEEVGPITRQQVVEFLGHANVRVVPVLDLADQTAVDAYEIPARMREALHLRTPACVSPWSGNLSRHKDADHVRPYLPTSRGGPQGQTRLDSLAPLARLPHRAKTHGRWSLRQPVPGVYEWRSPHGYRYRVDHTGTHPLGRGPAYRRDACPERRVLTMELYKSREPVELIDRHLA